MPVSIALQLIKGEASFWANQQKLIRPKLICAVDYYAGYVSESQLPKVRAYIRNQHEHHRRLSFAEEYEAFKKAWQG
jgi:putative transposase